MIQKSHKLFERVLIGNIIYIMLDDEQYAKFLNQDDPTILKALDVFKNGESLPKLQPAEAKKEKAIAGIYSEINRVPVHYALNSKII